MTLLSALISGLTSALTRAKHQMQWQAAIPAPALKTRLRNNMLAQPRLSLPGPAGRVAFTLRPINQAKIQNAALFEEQKYATAKLSRLQSSYKKLTVVARMVQGMSVDEAMLQMRKLTRKPARFIYDVLKSARANAVIGKGLDPGRLVVKHLIINKQAYTRGLVYHAKGRAGRRQKPYSRLIATIYEQPIEEIRRTGRIGNYGKQFVVPVLTGTYVDPFRRVDSELATELNQSIQEEQERNSSEKKQSDNTGAEGKKEIV